ncbi:MAG: DUF6503 family protein [Flavobacteriaceae bacterium]
MKLFRTFSLLSIVVLIGCNLNETPTSKELIQRVIEVSGWDHPALEMEFDFRDYHYFLKRQSNGYVYKRMIQKEGVLQVDEMSNLYPLQRTLAGTPIKLSDSLQQLYTNSLNSVLYFFQLPLPLSDEAVISELVGEELIEGSSYWNVKVSFQEYGGGEDFQDEYRYWIHKETLTIDYLAYNYQTSGGGTRFRKTIHPRNIEGFRFQNYINFKPITKFPSLDSLPRWFEEGKLEEVSRIENLNIKVKKNPSQ